MLNIAVITDIHLDEAFPKEAGVDSHKNWSRILKDIQSKNIQEIIFGGDIGEHTSNNYFFESLKAFNLKIILGNHDKFAEAIKYYKPNAAFNHSELYYFTETAFHKFIFLDSSTNKISTTQLVWLKNELNTTKKIIVFIHHPVLAVNTIVDRMYPLENREQVKELLFNSQKEIMIFCGHYHMEDERTERNISQFITPASSYQIEKDAETLKTHNHFFGYRIITLHEERIESKLVLHQ